MKTQVQYVTVLAKGIRNLITFSLVSRLVFPDSANLLVEHSHQYKYSKLLINLYRVKPCPNIHANKLLVVTPVDVIVNV